MCHMATSWWILYSCRVFELTMVILRHHIMDIDQSTTSSLQKVFSSSFDKYAL